MALIHSPIPSCGKAEQRQHLVIPSPVYGSGPRPTPKARFDSVLEPPGEVDDANRLKATIDSESHYKRAGPPRSRTREVGGRPRSAQTPVDGSPRFGRDASFQGRRYSRKTRLGVRFGAEAIIPRAGSVDLP